MDKPAFILPDEVVNILHQLSSDNDSIQFAVGDICHEILAEFEGVVPAVVVKRALASELRCEPVTLTDRVRVAGIVKPALRDKYELSFHQWRAVASVHDKTQVEAVAAWAISQADTHGGRSASVLAIRRYLHHNGADTPGWLRSWRKLVDIAEGIAADESAPDAVRSVCRGVVKAGISY